MAAAGRYNTCNRECALACASGGNGGTRHFGGCRKGRVPYGEMSCRWFIRGALCGGRFWGWLFYSKVSHFSGFDGSHTVNNGYGRDHGRCHDVVVRGL